jgi:hypothetical protein
MAKLELALVLGTTSLTEALRAIRPGTRALVVAAENREPLLVTAGDIMSAQNDAVDAQCDPEDVQVATVIPARMPAYSAKLEMQLAAGSRHAFDRDGVEPTGTRRLSYDALFKQKDERYAIDGFRSDSALIVTASKRFMLDLNKALVICRCSGTPVHTFEPQQLVTPNVCNKPHAAPVHCSQTSIIP